MQDQLELQVVFNFDSTLVTIEGPVALARRKGVPRQQIDEILQEAVHSNESFQSVFERRFELYRPSQSDIAWLCDQYADNMTPGAQEAVVELKAMGCRIYIVSASYRQAMLKTARMLGISPLNVCAVDLEFDADGQYQSYDPENILITDEGQGMVLAEIGKRGPVVFVADATRDARQRQFANYFIGFGGVHENAEVEQSADAYVSERSLLPVISHIKALKSRFEEEGYEASGTTRERFASTYSR